jgi:AraC-like DNA-binding protein
LEPVLTAPDEFDQIKLSSRSFAGHERAEAFRETFGRHILKIEMEPVKDTAFEVEMNLRALPGLAVATARMSPMACHHTSSLIDNDDPVLVFVQSGLATYRQNGHETTLRAGEAALTTNGLAGTGSCRTTTNIINWRISRSLIAPLVPNLDDAIGKPIDRTNSALPLFLGYAGVLNDQQTLATPEIRRAVVTHLLDLSALLLGARGDAAEIAYKRGVGAARLRGIKAHILAELGDVGLSLAAVAAGNGISVAYVRKLFESEGTTFSEFVLGHRLSDAYRRLTDLRFVNRSISAIAHEVGFNDLSYFNRTFRRAYGFTPSEVRTDIRRED